MSFSVGIVGLPNVGKSTLFQQLTKKQVDIADYPFTTIHPNIGVVPVPDRRLDAVAKIVKPEKITPTVIEFIDIAGLIKDAHLGKGLGNQFLDQIKNCDAILEVVDCFRENTNTLAERRVGDGRRNEFLLPSRLRLDERSSATPEADIETIKTELAAKGLDQKPIVYVYNTKD